MNPNPTSQITTAKLSFPKGGGAIQGIGETFQKNEFTGTASLSIPVSVWRDRLDPFSSYQAGFEVRTHRLCRHILMFHRFEELAENPVLVHVTRFLFLNALPKIIKIQSID